MTKSAGSDTGTKRTYRVQTTVEKLDGYFPGLATEVRMMLDQGWKPAKIAKKLRQDFPVQVTAPQVAYFRVARWCPQKEAAQAQATSLEAAWTVSKGGSDLDLLAVARIRELMDKSDIKEATAVRLSEVKIRDQELKELEFELKASRLLGSEQETGEDDDPAAQEAKTKRVMNKIRGIFGLDPLPDDTRDEDPQTEDQGTGTGENSVSAQEPVGAATESDG